MRLSLNLQRGFRIWTFRQSGYNRHSTIPCGDRTHSSLVHGSNRTKENNGHSRWSSGSRKRRFDLRLCLGFDASLILIESADVTAPKVVRSSVGAIFHVPWIQLSTTEARSFLEKQIDRFIDLRNRWWNFVKNLTENQPNIFIAGNEGSGIMFTRMGTSVAIEQSQELESLNVASAVAIVLHHQFLNA